MLLLAHCNCCEQLLILVPLLLCGDFFEVFRAPSLELVRVHAVLVVLGREPRVFIPDCLGASVVVVILLEDSREMHCSCVLCTIVHVLALPQLAFEDFLLTRVLS